MNRQHSPHGSGQTAFALTLIAATFLMGSSFVAGKILIQQGFPSLVLVGWRFLVAALATLPLVLLGKAPLRQAQMPAGVGARAWALAGLIGLLQTAGGMGLLFVELKTVSPSTAAILLFTNPIWVALMGRLFLDESLNGVRLSGLVLGVLGVGLAIGASPAALTGQSGALVGEGLGLGAAVCWASATIINKRARLPFSTWALSFWQMLVGAVALLIFAYANGEHWPQATSTLQWGWFLWLAIPGSTASFGLWFVALSKGGATRTSGNLFLAPLFATILSFFILGTTLTWMQGAGGVLIGVALWLVNRPHHQTGE
jgi:drug/metabolite transporter (DMT)-like permease